MQLPDFIIIPKDLILDKALQPLDREVYGIIHWASKMRDEKCTMSNQTIANILDANPSSISHSISRLSQQRYVFVKLNPETNQREELIPLVVNTKVLHPSSNELPPSSNELHNNTNNKINKEEDSLPPLLAQTSHNSIIHLTDLEKWQMATELDVPLIIVEQVNNAFWDYIELPKNRKKYKTSYKTIKRWIQRGLELGKYAHCNEVEVMFLESQHPDRLAEYKKIKEQAIKEGFI